MINLLNEKLKHPYFNTEWTVIGYENGKLQCVSDKSSVTEWITREYGLELYAEDQKRRADELEEKIKKIEKLHDAAIKSAGILYEDQKRRADEYQYKYHNLKALIMDTQRLINEDVTNPEDIIENLFDEIDKMESR